VSATLLAAHCDMSTESGGNAGVSGLLVLLNWREQVRAWLREFDAWIELRHDEEDIWMLAGEPSEYVAAANARLRTIRVYGFIPAAVTGLAIIAHEIGHIALDHRGGRPAYVQEYEAERFLRRAAEARRLQAAGRLRLRGALLRVGSFQARASAWSARCRSAHSALDARG